MKDIQLSIQDLIPDFNCSGKKDLFKELAKYLDNLINKDFQKLLNLLYRIDINEVKLRSLLNESIEKTAGEIIATLIIERQKEKAESRKNNQSPDLDSNEEPW